ncbi:class II glutamine amidotransferase [Flexibacterium corallicola]|uniref:class II glutamine amidotransferase n=1 Tax=Flexibacterium corallicola TaxID=3037259 RepID=UPI00286EE1BC|nr:class II glutamine amidotransferase [Pseudovibrio sp. M1P-2-3]
MGDEIYLENLIRQPEHSLIAQSRHCSEAKVDTNGDGFGFGWYGQRTEPGQYRDTQPAWGDENLSNLVHQISSNLFFAHVRASTGTATSRANCHPFSADNCLFMHNGQIGGYQKIRRQVEKLISDHYYMERKGTTDSEALFLALLSHGLKDNPQAAFEFVLSKILEMMRATAIQEALRVTAAFTDGTKLHVFRYSSDHIVPSLYYRLSDRSITVVSEPLDPMENEWQKVPAGQMLVFDGKAIPKFNLLELAEPVGQVA